MMALMLTAMAAMAADTKQQYVPSSFGGWQNLSASVNDITHYTSDPLPMQAAISRSCYRQDQKHVNSRYQLRGR